jgi:sugar (pentulose or hexulose) kinase
VTGRPVLIPPGGEVSQSARGAAVLAALAADGERLPGPPGPAVAAEPDQERAARWEAAWERYESARTAITAHYQRQPR